MLQKNIKTSSKYTWQDYEDKMLSPLAMKSKYSKGRKHYEKEHPYRSLYQRDRDRIIHSAAFRRLEYKTQVFVTTMEIISVPASPIPWRKRR
jgi:dGTP triphosphohydrolase